MIQNQGAVGFVEQQSALREVLKLVRTFLMLVRQGGPCSDTHGAQRVRRGPDAINRLVVQQD